ncbi:MAG TPA: PQQ-binding-like beta-propeller repeat protein, partial [Rhizomicrobium sp.]
MKSHYQAWTIVAAIVAALGMSKAVADDLQSLTQDDKQWVMPAKNFASTRFSSLNQINAGNAGKLQVAWSFSVGSNHGQEAAPIVVGDTMYIVGAYPNELFALDATTGDLKWKYSPRVDPASQGVACCDVVNRGEAYDNGKIFFNTLDDHTIAVDAKTGKEVWVAKLGEITKGQTMTMAPLVADGKVFVGNSGGEMGIRGWVTALDENTGKIV